MQDMGWIDLAACLAENPPTPKEIEEVERLGARKAKPRFYADANFPAQAVALLRELGARVTTTHEVHQNGHPDENHIAFALRNRLVFLTCDTDFLDNIRFPLIHCPSIFVFNFGHGTDCEIRQAFQCLGSVFGAPQFFDKWCKVHAKRASWTELSRFRNGRTRRSRFRIWRGRVEEWIDG
jgi:predicted nuclease of predicted toxin-antitoxin system